MAFVEAAKTADLMPGQGKTVRARGRDYALFNLDGEYFCIDNECPHQDGPLGDGEIEGDSVLCPWHAWQVNIRTGDVLGTSQCVAKHACKIEGDMVLIEI